MHSEHPLTVYDALSLQNLLIALWQRLHVVKLMDVRVKRRLLHLCTCTTITVSCLTTWTIWVENIIWWLWCQVERSKVALSYHNIVEHTRLLLNWINKLYLNVIRYTWLIQLVIIMIMWSRERHSKDDVVRSSRNNNSLVIRKQMNFY